jgi:hypothetical protein
VALQGMPPQQMTTNQRWTRTLLNVTAQFGITGHVPDFRVITSLPIRF